MDLTRGLLVLVAACSSNKRPHVEDARRPTPEPAADAAPAPIADAAPAAPATGDVQIRVEWAKMPLAARISPGPSACGTPLVAQVAPTTTWGIPEVIIFVDGAPARPPDVRVVVDRCTIAPRVAVGTRLAIASAAEQPLGIALTKQGEKKPTSIQLPIMGHEVTTDLVPAAIYRLAGDGKVDDAWIATSPATVTDAQGTALIKDVAPGTHAVRAWLPPRGGQPAREAKGSVTVAAGDLAELTLTLE